MDEYEAMLRAARNLGDLIVAMYGENGPSGLTQIFMKGPFAGMSVREVLLLGYKLRDEQPPRAL